MFRFKAWRNNWNKFAFSGGFLSIEENFSNLKIIRDNPEEDCLAAQFSRWKDYLELKSVKCDVANVVICRRSQLEEYNCTDHDSQGNRKKRSEDDVDGRDIGSYYTLDLLLNPALRYENSRAIALKRNRYKDIFSKVRCLVKTVLSSLFLIVSCRST